ncbi:hypothetical protein AOCH_006491 [Aspergillus ochraceoroseus]|uniref:Cyclopropane-fatty-acyl-phospholipid synthase n=1 Tax=Aspergillus ochraceoroseus TaxID=138278 RepID=A0A0F8XR69_9EURO|nr:hypothetical protein AOCH_006491 [Aspergillus ochraceoroseus]
MILALGCAQIFLRWDRLLFDILILTSLLALILPLWLTVICYSSRSLQRDQQTPKVFLGEPRLLATQVSHTRLGTGHYNYSVPHFLVGTPVGLQGRIGSVLSLDEGDIPTQTQTDRLSLSSRLGQYFSSKTWFTIHAHHHLAKGNDSLGLEGKLRNFLLSKGEDPDEWPYAYLVSMPQFLGYQRNLVCFWYLYSSSRELTAMVMEVNNYWGQRKIAFSRLVGESPLPTSSSSSSSSSSPEVTHRSVSGPTASSHHSHPRHQSYRGHWDKDMFISPFEKVEGSIALRFSDPLAPNARLHITIALLSVTGKPRLIGRVFCPEDHDSLAPRTASSWQLLRFLPYWTGVLVVTELLIMLRRYASAPKAPCNSSLCPSASASPSQLLTSHTSRKLETPFRRYLQHLVDHCSSPLRLEYIPVKSHHLKPVVTFTSPTATSASPTLTIQVLAPQFYTSILTYQDPILAFTEESRPSPLPSDPSSRRLRISDLSLLLTTLATSSPTGPPPHHPAPGSSTYQPPSSPTSEQEPQTNPPSWTDLSRARSPPQPRMNTALLFSRTSLRAGSPWACTR